MKILSFLLLLSISCFSQSNGNQNKATLPIYLKTFFNDKETTINVKSIKQTFADRKIKFVSEEAVNRWFQDQYAVIREEMIKRNGQLSAEDMSKRINSQKPFAMMLNLYFFGSFEKPDSVTLKFILLPPNGSKESTISFKNNEKYERDIFLGNCIDKCLEDDYFN